MKSQTCKIVICFHYLVSLSVGVGVWQEVGAGQDTRLGGTYQLTGWDPSYPAYLAALGQTRLLGPAIKHRQNVFSFGTK